MRLARHEWPAGTKSGGSDAPLALLVHGVNGWHRTWWRVGPALAAAGWRVVAVDQRGHGHSPPISEPVTVRDLAADVAETLDELGAADLVIGHSLGGAVAVELAAAHPELVRRLVLEDPAAITRVSDAAWLDAMQQQAAVARADPHEEVARTLAREPAWLPEDARQDVEARAMADVDGIIASFAADIGSRVVELVPDLPMPTLLILADPARSVVPPAARQDLAARSGPGVSVVELDSGHTIHRDRFDDYVTTIVDWAGAPRIGP